MSKRKTAKVRVAMGQTGLLVSLLLIALLLGLIPDRDTAIRQGRAALAESMAMSVTRQAMKLRISEMESDLKLIVERNDQLLSAAVQRFDAYCVEVGEHAEHWKNMPGELSNDSQVLVPIHSGDKRWGQLELRFEPSSGFLGQHFAQSQCIPLILFLTLAGFLVFYHYLGKMLRHLDPSRAIPQRVQSALDTMAEGLLVIDIKSQVVLANRAFAEIIGKNVEELLGWKIHDFDWEVQSHSAEVEQAPWEKCLESGQQQRNSVVCLTDQHDLDRTFIVNCSPVMGAGGKHGGALISFDDVTQLEQKKKELGEARDAAETANRTKSEFLANMSHEIRTPMNAILGFTDILRRGYGTTQQDPRRYLNTIHSSGTHLLQLINDILDLSKVESGRMDVERIACSPHLIVNEAIQVLAVKAIEKGIELGFEVDGLIPETVFTDPSRLRQILTNLIGNAIKFTETGGVKVILSLVEDAEPKVRIDVRDSGIGMSPDQVDRIFDPFAQADSSVTRRFGGTGLGLTISRKFAEALGGGIAVDSNPGVGSVFTVIIDAGEIDGIQRMHPDELNYDQFGSGSKTQWKFDAQRILVVDDGQENRDLIRVVLEEVGLIVEDAENGKVGAELAVAKPYDFIFMDMQMPVMDGYDATRLLRENGIQTPIYALTANAMQGFEKKCLAAGCTGFMTKPIDIDLLLRTLAEVLGGSEIEIAAEPPVSITVGTPTKTSAFSPEQGQEHLPLVSSLPMNVPAFAKVVRTFASRLVEELEKMAVSLHAGDFAGLAQHAHWLKGSGGTCGFAKFSEAAARLETCAKQENADGAAQTLQEIVFLADRIEVCDPVDNAPAPVLPGNAENNRVAVSMTTSS